MRFIIRYVIIWLAVLLLPGAAIAQTVVRGVVYDNVYRQRIAQVYIYNMRTTQGGFNNVRGEFTLNAKAGDKLVFAVSGYGPDTLTYTGQPDIYVGLRPLGIRLRDVKITGKALTPAEYKKAQAQSYDYAVKRGTGGSLLQNVGTNGTGVGVGLSIDYIYNLLSKQGKDARRLQKVLERDYHDKIVNYRFNEQSVQAIIALRGDELKDFIEQYKPTYLFVLSANDYDFEQYVRNAYQRYLDNPAAQRLPALPKLPPEGQRK